MRSSRAGSTRSAAKARSADPVPLSATRFVELPNRTHREVGMLGIGASAAHRSESVFGQTEGEMLSSAFAKLEDSASSAHDVPRGSAEINGPRFQWRTMLFVSLAF